MARQPLIKNIQSKLPESRKVYFVSDAHLGLPPREKSIYREAMLVKWLDEIKSDASELFLMGDIFDYWFEYKKVVPRGFVRFLGKLAELSDQGVKIRYFTGNHDVWVFDYLPTEVGLEVFHKPLLMDYGDKLFYLAHGDGLGPGERSYKLLKSIFRSKFLQWMYARIHPNTSAGFAHRWSSHSRFSQGNFVPWLGEDKEHLVLHSKTILEKLQVDFFVYGHRHVPKEIEIENSKIVYLGDWFINFTYAVFDGKELKLMNFEVE